MENVGNMHKTAAALAVELETLTGRSWTYVQFRPGHRAEEGLPNWCELNRDDGLSLTVSNKTNNGKPRILIYQSMNCEAWRDSDGDVADPREYMPGGGREAFPSISVTATKTAKTIAKDIVRRVMPDAGRLHVKGLDRAAAYTRSNDKRDEFGTAMGCDDTNRNGYRTRRIYESRTPAGVGSVDIEAASFGIKIEIADLSTERALAVLKALGIKV
ncbi:MAG: hypothetical protein ACTSX8_10460 [Alphaproteobacteria bacterium]